MRCRECRVSLNKLHDIFSVFPVGLLRLFWVLLLALHRLLKPLYDHLRTEIRRKLELLFLVMVLTNDVLILNSLYFTKKNSSVMPKDLCIFYSTIPFQMIKYCCNMDAIIYFGVPCLCKKHGFTTNYYFGTFGTYCILRTKQIIEHL